MLEIIRLDADACPPVNGEDPDPTQNPENKRMAWGNPYQIRIGRTWTRFEVSIPFDSISLIARKSLIVLFYIPQYSVKLSHFEEILIVDDDRSVFDRWVRKLQAFSGKLDVFEPS